MVEEYCTECGAALSGPGADCPSCAGKSGTGEDPQILLDWVYEIRIVNNLLMIRDMVLAFGIGLIGVALIVFIAGEAWESPELFRGFMTLIGILVGMVVVLFLIAAALLGNAIPTRFFLTSSGVGYEAATSREGNISKAAIIVGALARSPGTMGAGLIAASQESDFCTWDDVQKVTVYNRQRAIDIKYSIFKPIRLYCTEENFTTALDLVKRYAVHATFRIR